MGDTAKDHAAFSPASTVYSAKRLLGRGLEDASVQACARHFPTALLQGPAGAAPGPLLRTRQGASTRDVSPEEASAALLLKLKAAAEAHLGEDVTRAVVAVPATFTRLQRNATMQACALAGLHLMRLINDPHAAAFAFDQARRGRERNVLVFDLGAGFLSVALHAIEDGLLEVKATAGDSHLGGEDFDTCLVQWCTQEFQRRTALDMSGDERARRRLRVACEGAKRALSAAAQTTIDIEALHEGERFQAVVTRAQFEELAAGCLSRVLAPVERVLRDAGVAKGEVHEVVLAGGSSRIPRVQQLLQEYFDGKALCKSLNADEAVATGATVMAAILDGQHGGKLDNTILLEATPFTLSVETAGGVATELARRNTPIPFRKSQTFTTAADSQTVVHIRVFEGEHALAKDNTFIGELLVSGIPPLPRGEPRIEVTCDIGANCIITVTAVEKSTGKTSRLVVDDHVVFLGADDARLKIQAAQTALALVADPPAGAGAAGGGGGGGNA